jgi:DNA-directed RNA polymerase subunit RPC12/RpoP
MKETRKVHYVKGVFVCPKCRQSYVQEKWIEEWRVRCHKCDYRGTLTEVSVEERMEEEIVFYDSASLVLFFCVSFLLCWAPAPVKY